LPSFVDPISLWRRGLSVFPIPAPGPGGADGKTPRVYWKRYQYHHATTEEVRRWFAPGWPVNVGIVTGEISEIVVVDLDGPEAVSWARRNLRSTPWFTRTRKGWHAFYRWPGELVGNRARVNGLPIDVRGDGGYVLGPGSVHASGHVYRAIGRWAAPRSSLPIFPADLFERPVAVKPDVTRRAVADVSDRARRYLARIPFAPEGQGSDHRTFLAACRLVRGFALPPETAVNLLQEWAPAFDTWWLTGKIDSALKNGKDPVGALV
jgi:hypothetical protein